MRLSLKGLAITMGILFGSSVFLVGGAHVIWPGYGGAFLEVVASIYPGYHVGGFGQVVVGTLYALLDGAVFGALVAWLYNAASRTGTQSAAV